MALFNAVKTAAIIGAALSAIGVARASDEIIDPSDQDVIATSYYSQDVIAAPLNLVNDSGLSFDLPDGAQVPETYPTHSTNLGDMYWSGSEHSPTIRFALTHASDIHSLHYWNFNQAGGGHHSPNGTERGVKLVAISVSTESILGPYNPVGTYTFAEATGSPDYRGDDLALGTTARAKYIQFTVLTNWGGDFPGLSEIRFIGNELPDQVNLTGTVKLGGWLGTAAALQSLPVKVSVDGGAAVSVNLTNINGSTGDFNIAVPSTGTHTVQVMPQGFLAQTISIDTDISDVSASFLGHDNTSGLLPGDASGDNVIDDFDLTDVILDFGAAPSGNNGFTDTNGDQLVDDFDLTDVILNFGRIGD